jgi:hypothetical protein
MTPADVVLRQGIGWAVYQMERGEKVRRAGWNGKGMWLILVPGSQDLTVDEGRPLAKAGLPIGLKFNYARHVDIWTASGTLVPWNCSQADLLADDWEIAD